SVIHAARAEKGALRTLRPHRRAVDGRRDICVDCGTTEQTRGGHLMMTILPAARRRALPAVVLGAFTALIVTVAKAQSPAPAVVPPVPGSTPDQEKLRILAAKRY